MWAALFDFCLFFLLLGFLLYGLKEWNNLLADHEDDDGMVNDQTPPLKASETSQDSPSQRIALWVLIGGLGIVSIISELLNWLDRS